MKVKEMKSILTTNKFDNIECNFKLKTGKPKVTLESMANKLEYLASRLEELTLEVRQGFTQVNNRIDNLVSKNNLKE